MLALTDRFRCPPPRFEPEIEHSRQPHCMWISLMPVHSRNGPTCKQTDEDPGPERSPHRHQWRL